MLKAEWGLIEFVRISAPSDANLSFHISPSAAVAWHSCHPPNPHFVTLPILISFSYVFLSVFLNFTFTIFPTAYFSVELANSSVFAQRDWLQIISGTVLPVEGKSPVSIFFGETALHCKLMVPGLHQTKPYCADAAICCGLAALQLIQILPSPARISRDFAKAIKKCCSSSFKLITLV